MMSMWSTLSVLGRLTAIVNRQAFGLGVVATVVGSDTSRPTR